MNVLTDLMLSNRNIAKALGCVIVSAILGVDARAADSPVQWRVGLVTTTSAAEGEKLREEVVRETQTRRPNVSFDVVLTVMREGQTVQQVIANALQNQPKILVVMAASLAEEARRQNPRVPIVFKTAFDPVATGLVESAMRPGRNMSGFSQHAAVFRKRWEILAQALPTARRVGVLLNTLYYREGSELLPTTASGVLIEAVEWTPKDGFRALDAIVRARKLDVLDIGPGVLQSDEASALITWANKRKLPTVFHAHALVSQGGLLSFSAIPLDHAKTIAEYLDQVMNGTSAGELLVRYPNQFSIALNAKTMGVLRLKLPTTFLRRVDVWQE